MIVTDRSISKFLAFHEERLSSVLQKISENRHRIIFTVSESGRLEGVLTDGDFRRWVVNQQGAIDINVAVREVANDAVTFVNDGADPLEIEQLLIKGRDAIPVLDEYRHVVAVAYRGSDDLRIGRFGIGAEHPAFVIAEIGNNHQGSVSMAKELVDLAADAGADCVKFQLRDMASLYRVSGTVHGAGEDLGAEYTLDLLAKYNLSAEQLFEVFDYCKNRGVLPMCTPWDLRSAQALAEYGIEAYKIASADLTNAELITAVTKSGRPMIISTGMSREAEIVEATALLRKLKAQFVLLHCNSTYPTPFKDVNLRYLVRLREIAGSVVGYSGHERGYQVVMAAIAMGAKVIEKHFTLDRGLEGNDHRVSLLPTEFAEMVRAIRDVESAMGGTGATAGQRDMTQGELMNREVLAKSLVATRDIALGEIIDESMVAIRSPGRGVQPNRKDELIGRRSMRNITSGDFFYSSDLEDDVVKPRPFQFDRPWGVPVRFHDAHRLIGLTNLDLVEYHLSYKDLTVDIHAIFAGRPLPIGYVVHSPELFEGDHILDLASIDPQYRARSIVELRRVIAMTRALREYHQQPEDPVIVTNVGGFEVSGFLPVAERERRYALVADALKAVSQAGAEVIIQTMPPFPWHFGGQSHHNLFVDPDETAAFCEQNGVRLCLDISHAILACNQNGWSLADYVAKVGPYVAHLHLADGKGTDGEGIQIGEGQVDFRQISRQLAEVSPKASFIPEIWQGHKNDGEGFWVALGRLESLGVQQQRLSA